jgi:hypothetical protein
VNSEDGRRGCESHGRGLAVDNQAMVPELEHVHAVAVTACTSLTVQVHTACVTSESPSMRAHACHALVIVTPRWPPLEPRPRPQLDGTRVLFGGLRLRLYEPLRPEPCQTVELHRLRVWSRSWSPSRLSKGRWSHVLVASPDSN